MWSRTGRAAGLVCECACVRTCVLMCVIYPSPPSGGPPPRLGTALAAQREGRCSWHLLGGGRDTAGRPTVREAPECPRVTVGSPVSWNSGLGACLALCHPVPVTTGLPGPSEPCHLGNSLIGMALPCGRVPCLTTSRAGCPEAAAQWSGPDARKPVPVAEIRLLVHTL